MKKCLKVTILELKDDSIALELQKKGSKLMLEGTLQYSGTDRSLKMVICGLKDDVDKFVDYTHSLITKTGIVDLHIEPFVKTRDYRGAFRLIE